MEGLGIRGKGLVYRKKYFWKVRLKDDAKRIFSRKLWLFFFKLSNFVAQPTESRKHFESGMVKWPYHLKNIQNMSEQDLKNEEEPVFWKLLEVCQYSNSNNMEQEEYRKSLWENEGIRDAIECAQKVNLHFSTLYFSFLDKKSNGNHDHQYGANGISHRT